MQEVSIYDYYAFGYNYHIIRRSLKGRSVEDVLKAIDKHVEKITTLELQVTSHVVGGLRRVVENLKSEKQDSPISDEALAQIKKAVEEADLTLDAELQLKKVLSVTPKRFDMEMLLERPENLLAKESWKCLSETGQKDFAQAARCVAMNLATAAAFHLMRAVEESVKLLYFEFVKHNRMQKPMWGPMIDKLRAKNKPKPSPELLDQLDMIRRNFRNPTQHPDKFYSIDEAQDLLNGSIVAINGACREISLRKNA
jgi:hypothetical protein